MNYYEPGPKERAIESIEAYILKNNLKTHDKLPSERTMCQMWNLSRSTLRSALTQLIDAGRLYAVQGSGIRIAPRLKRTLLDLKSFTVHALSLSHDIETRLLYFTVIECDKHLSRRFQRTLGEKLYKISRLRIIDKIPVMIETAYIPVELAPGLDEHDLVKGSLFNVLENYYNINLDHGEEKTSITSVSEEEASLLNIDPGSPAIWLVSTTKDINNTIIEYCRTVARADIVEMESTLFWQENDKNYE